MEEEAESVLIYGMGEKGYRIEGEPFHLSLNGEVDVILPIVVEPDGQRLWVVAESEVRLPHREISAWANRIRSRGFRIRLRKAGVPGPYLAYAFGMRVDPGAAQAAQQAGIGFLTGRGERIAPAGVIPALGSE